MYQRTKVLGLGGQGAILGSAFSNGKLKKVQHATLCSSYPCLDIDIG